MSEASPHLLGTVSNDCPNAFSSEPTTRLARRGRPCAISAAVARDSRRGDGCYLDVAFERTDSECQPLRLQGRRLSERRTAELWQRRRPAQRAVLLPGHGSQRRDAAFE